MRIPYGDNLPGVKNKKKYILVKSVIISDRYIVFRQLQGTGFHLLTKQVKGPDLSTLGKFLKCISYVHCLIFLFR